MKNKNKKIYAALLFVAGILLCVLFVWRHGLFASKVDWLSQHSVFPDYFRKRFYETKQLFPDIAWNIGGGQNIYNFSYYGLFSPVILLSYLLPFVKMDIYIMVSSMICYGLSGTLFFWWISDKNLSAVVKILTSVLFMLSGSLMYHFYNQLMFVNYMPFLILALIGCDRFFKDGSYKLLVISVVAIILTSYYFSIGCLLSLCLYAFGKSDFKGKKIIVFGTFLMLAIMVCGFLLAPTAFSLISGERAGGGASIGGTKLLEFRPQRFLYSPYGLGLCAIVLWGIAGSVIFAKNIRRRLQSIFLVLIMCIPVIAKLLNGGLYEKDKVFLPFLPFVCLLIAQSVNKIMEMEIFMDGHLRKKVTAGVIFLNISVLLILIHSGNEMSYEKYGWLLLVDGGLLVLGVMINLKWKKVPLALISACVIMLVYGSKMNLQADMIISKNDYSAYEFKEKNDEIENVLSENDGFYRTECIFDNRQNYADINRIFDIGQNITSIYSSGYNSTYMKFRDGVFNLNKSLRNKMMQQASDNPFFLQFMGVRYVLGESCPAGFTKISETDAGNLYENKNTAPLCYGTTKVISEKKYDKLHFPENQSALLNWAVVEDNVDNNNYGQNFKSKFKSSEIKLPEISDDNLQIVACDDGYEITAKEDTKITLPVNSAEENVVLAFSCKVENLQPRKDMHIRINGQTNRLTSISHEYANENKIFHFVVSLTEENTIEFSKGHYKITCLQWYEGDFDSLHNEELYEARFDFDKDSMKNDYVKGNINMKKDGWFVTSFPYDEGFKILVDGKYVDTIKVNKGFLGTKLDAGKHEITIEYNARGKVAGIVMSIVAVAVLVVVGVSKRRGD